jgi:hypothetical protein
MRRDSSTAPIVPRYRSLPICEIRDAGSVEHLALGAAFILLYVIMTVMINLRGYDAIRAVGILSSLVAFAVLAHVFKNRMADHPGCYFLYSECLPSLPRTPELPAIWAIRVVKTGGLVSALWPNYAVAAFLHNGDAVIMSQFSRSRRSVLVEAQRAAKVLRCRLLA